MNGTTQFDCSALPALLLLLSGCGSDGAAYQADPGQAQQTLRTVLDAWKAGEKPASLENQTPRILVKDSDWQDGFTLVSYQADAEGKLVGYDMNYPVVLELKSPKGNTRQEEKRRVHRHHAPRNPRHASRGLICPLPRIITHNQRSFQE